MIGIVGGIGPFAGKDLLEKVFENTIAHSDQEHLDVALLSMSSKIEDRTEYLLGRVNDNPGLAIAQVLTKLEKIGVTVAGLPCNTAHAEQIFDVILNELAASKSKIKVLHMVDETVKFIVDNFADIKRVGVLSTTGTYKSGLYKNALESAGFEAVVPTPEMQKNTIRPAIYHPLYGIKTISQPVDERALNLLLKGVSFLKEQGAEAIVLGCTEIPLALTETTIDNVMMVNPTNILARALINEYCPEKLKK